MGNTAQQCILGLLQDSDFAGDLEDSKSTSGGLSCTFGSQTFVPTSWMCKKQTSVSHSSTEAEMISLDAGLHMDGVPALGWSLGLSDRSIDQESQGDLSRNTTLHMKHQNSTKHADLDLSDVDHGSSNVRPRVGAILYIFEDNEAVVEMIIKGRSPTMRHVSRNPQSCSGLVV